MSKSISVTKLFAGVSLMAVVAGAGAASATPISVTGNSFTAINPIPRGVRIDYVYIDSSYINEAVVNQGTIGLVNSGSASFFQGAAVQITNEAVLAVGLRNGINGEIFATSIGIQVSNAGLAWWC